MDDSMTPDSDAVAVEWAVPCQHDFADQYESPSTCSHLERVPAIEDTDPLGDRILLVSTNKCVLNADGRHEHKEAMRFRVCSRTLARASPVMRAMLFGSFREAEQDQVDLPDDDPVAMRMLLHIAHGKFALICLAMDDDLSGATTDDFYDVTALANKYLITHLLRPWATRILARFAPWQSRSCNPVSYEGPSIHLEKALFMAGEFGHVDLYENILSQLVWCHRRDQQLFSQSLEPDDASERIRIGRLKVIKAILNVLHKATANPSNDNNEVWCVEDNWGSLLQEETWGAPTNQQQTGVVDDNQSDYSQYSDSSSNPSSWACSQESDTASTSCMVHTFGILTRHLSRHGLMPLPNAFDVSESPRQLCSRFGDTGVWSNTFALHDDCQTRETFREQLNNAIMAPELVEPWPTDEAMGNMLSRSCDFGISYHQIGAYAKAVGRARPETQLCWRGD